MRFLLRMVAVTAAAGALLLAGLPAQADTIMINDRERDGQQGPALDFTSVKVVNRKYGVVIEASFREVVPGDLALYVLPAGSSLDDQVKLVSSLRARRVKNSLTTEQGKQRCRGLTVTWDRDADTFHARLPAQCILGGDYRAVRVRLITEIGADTDLSPDGPRNAWPWSRLVPRG